MTESDLPDLFSGSATAESEQDLDAVIYARTSSASQEHGHSIDGQVGECWQRCERMGWTVTYVFIDRATSGKDPDRPMFQRMLDRAEAGSFDVVVFWKLDRFSRSLIHAVRLEQELRDWGVGLHSTTEQIDTTTPTGRFNFRSISSASEFERDLIQQRAQLGMKELARAEKWPNDRPPLGYELREDDRLAVLEDEADTVEMMFERYLELKSMPQLAAELNRTGIPTKAGEEWTARGVGDVLRNELYMGEYSVAGVEKHVPEYQLVEEELFERVTDVRTRFQKDKNASRREMEKPRKERHVMNVTEQFKEYLQQSDTLDPR